MKSRCQGSRLIGSVFPVLVLLVAAPAFSQICAVPSATYPTIQSAVDDESCTAIDVAAGTYLENLFIDHTVTINGDPSSATVIDGGNAGRVIDAEEAGSIEPPCCAGTLTLNDLELRYGFVHLGQGAGVYVSGGTVNLNHCRIDANFNEGGSGGGLYMASGDVTMNDCSVDGNVALDGGGVYVEGGELTMNASLVYVNEAEDPFGVGAPTSGGGLVNGGAAHLINCTVFGNSALSSPGAPGPARGGAIVNGGTLQVDYGTIVQNVAGPGGLPLQPSTSSGIAGTATLRSTILASNDGTSCDSSSTFTDGGYNLSDDASCGFAATGSANGAGSLNLGSLADNGGPTLTIALVAPSAAIDGIPAGTNSCGTSIAADQRGVSRPQSARCDIGAFEVEISSLPCPKPLGYWKNAADWPVRGLVIGGTSYTAADLLEILTTPNRGDASLILADQLIPAMLNVAAGAAEAQTALDAIASANALLSQYARLPLRLRPARAFEMLALASTLSAYNNDALTSGCMP